MLSEFANHGECRQQELSLNRRFYTVSSLPQVYEGITEKSCEGIIFQTSILTTSILRYADEGRVEGHVEGHEGSERRIELVFFRQKFLSCTIIGQ